MMYEYEHTGSAREGGAQKKTKKDEERRKNKLRPYSTRIHFSLYSLKRKWESGKKGQGRVSLTCTC